VDGNHLGVDLEQPLQPVAQATWQGNDLLVEPVGMPGWSTTLVLPPYRHLDWDAQGISPMSRWNCGLPHRQDQCFGGNLGRMPTWAIWSLLGEQPEQNGQWLEGTDRRNHTYQCLRTSAHGSSEDRTFSARELLAPCLRRLQAEGFAASAPVVAIPNTLNEWAQEDVLGSLPWPEGEMPVLWRPVAAALGWAEALAPDIRRRVADRSLLVVELREGCVTLDLLTLRISQKDGLCLAVPVRRLPHVDRNLYLPTVPLSFRWAERLLETHGVPITSESLWHLAVGTDGAMRGLQCRPGEEWRSPLIPTPHGWRELVLSAEECGKLVFSAGRAIGPIACELGDGLAQRSRKSSTTLNAARIRDVVAFIDEHRPGAVLVHGPLCAAGAGPRGTLGQEFLRLLSKEGVPARTDWHVEGVANVPVGLVARGAAIVGARAARGLPTYLDELRRLDILVQRDEQIVEQSLIEGGEIDGNQPYRGLDQEGFFLYPGNSFVEFYLQFEGMAKLRHLRQDLAVETESQVDLVLRPSQQAARGHAKVEVRNPIFPGGSVLLDWRRMETSSKSRQDLQDGIRRSYPPDLPEVSSSDDLWLPFREEASGYLMRRRRAFSLAFSDDFFPACAAVRFDPADLNGLGRLNVFGSGGTDEDLPRDRGLVMRYLEALREDLDAHPNDTNVIRAIAWTYQGDRFLKLRKGLVAKLGRRDPKLEHVEFTACAQLFREPEEYVCFFDAALSRFSQGIAGVNWFLNGLRKLFTYRNDVLEHIDSHRAERMAWYLGRIVEEALRAGELKNTLLEGLLCLLFILRRRKYARDGSFLRNEPCDPDAFLRKLGAQSIIPEKWSGPTLFGSDLMPRLLALAKLAEIELKRAASRTRRHASAKKLLYRKRVAEQLSHFLQGAGSLEGFVSMMKDEEG